MKVNIEFLPKECKYLERSIKYKCRMKRNILQTFIFIFINKSLSDRVSDWISSPAESNCYFHCFLKRLAKFSQHFIFTKRLPPEPAFWLLLKKSFSLSSQCSGGKGVFARSLQADKNCSDSSPFCYLTISLVILSSNDFGR